MINNWDIKKEIEVEILLELNNNITNRIFNKISIILFNTKDIRSYYLYSSNLYKIIILIIL